MIDRQCPTCGCPDKCAEAEYERAVAEAKKWKARCEAAEEALRLAMDEGLRAW